MTIEPTDEEVEAAARAECAFDKSNYDAMSRSGRERYFARTKAALTAAAQVRGGALDAAALKRWTAPCQHVEAIGSGSIGSDGSGYTAWYCPRCGKSQRIDTPPRATPPTSTAE